MTEVKKVRPSFADCGLMCSGSLVPCAHPINGKSDDARIGKAKHEIAARLLAKTLKKGDFIKYGEYYDVDSDGLEAAALAVRGVWEQIKGEFPKVAIERKLFGVVSDGTTDFASIEAGKLGDWKFGRSYDEHPNQLLGYADGVLAERNEEMPECGYISAYEIWVAHGDYREYRFTKARIDGYRSAMIEQIKNVGNQYNPGAHCRFCPRMYECEARLKYISSTANTLARADQSMKAWTRSDLAAIYDQVKMVKDAADKYYNIVKDHLKEGPLQLDEKRQVELTHSKTTYLIPDKTWKVLTKEYGYTKEDMDKCVEIKKEPMEKIIRDRTEKGKQKAADKLIDDLKFAGAVIEGTKEVRRVKAIK